MNPNPPVFSVRHSARAIRLVALDPPRSTHGQKGTEVEFQLNATNLVPQSSYTLVRRDPDGQVFRAVLNPPTTYTFTMRFSL